VVGPAAARELLQPVDGRPDHRRIEHARRVLVVDGRDALAEVLPVLSHALSVPAAPSVRAPTGGVCPTTEGPFLSLSKLGSAGEVTTSRGPTDFHDDLRKPRNENELL